MRALIIASTASMIDQFNKNHIALLQSMGYQVDVACNFYVGNTCDESQIDKLIRWFEENNIRYYQIDFERNARKIHKHIEPFRQLKRIAVKEQYDIVHCHTPIGGLLGRMCFAMTNTKIIYTAHGLHFFKGAPMMNWLLYFPFEWLCSFVTDVLLTINTEDYAFAKKHLHAKRTEYVHGIGVDLEKFSKRINNDEKQRIRTEFGIKPNDKFILSVGELIPRKNHIEVLKALVTMDYNKIKYVICGKGDLKASLQNTIEKEKLENTVKLIGFRTNVAALCNAADLFILPSFQEGLSVALMEAVACKTPVVCSDIRGNRDLVTIENLFTLGSTKQLSEMMQNGVAKWTIDANYENLQKFSVENVMREMEAIYNCKTE